MFTATKQQLKNEVRRLGGTMRETKYGITVTLDGAVAFIPHSADDDLAHETLNILRATRTDSSAAGGDTDSAASA